MMSIVTMLDELQTKALHDKEIRRQLLQTRESEEPLSAFGEK